MKLIYNDNVIMIYVPETKTFKRGEYFKQYAYNEADRQHIDEFFGMARDHTIGLDDGCLKDIVIT